MASGLAFDERQDLLGPGKLGGVVGVVGKIEKGATLRGTLLRRSEVLPLLSYFLVNNSPPTPLRILPLALAFLSATERTPSDVNPALNTQIPPLLHTRARIFPIPTSPTISAHHDGLSTSKRPY